MQRSLIALFHFKRAVLDAVLEIKGRAPLHVMNTHLSAWSNETAGGDNQAAEIDKLVGSLKAKDLPWIIAGDFNLLPPGFKKEKLHPDTHYLYDDDSKISLLFGKYNSATPLSELIGEEQKRYYTFNSNHPEITDPDRTIDYIFYSNLLLLDDSTGEYSNNCVI